MRKLRILLFEVIGFAVLVGWLMWKYPELVDDIIPWVALGIAWHLTYEYILDTQVFRRWACAFGKKIKPMIAWPLVFLLGGAVSLGYWKGIDRSLKRLSAIAEARAATKRAAPNIKQQPDQPIATKQKVGLDEKEKEKTPDKSPGVPDKTPPGTGHASTQPSKPPTFVEKQGDYIVSLGGNTASIPASGGMFPMLGSGDDWLVRAHVENGRFLVDAKLFSGRNSGAVLMENNQFSVEQPSWDRNFDDTAFEVVNEKLVPVLQIIYSLPRTMNIYGLFGDRPTLISPKGISGLALGTPITQENYPVKRLFKYPSRRYQGQELDVDQTVTAPDIPTRGMVKPSLTVLSDGQRFVLKQQLQS